MRVITKFDADVAGKRASAATNPNGPMDRLATWLANTKLLVIMAVAVVAFSVSAATAQVAPAEPVKNSVFVHGAFAGGSSLAKVITILQAKGYNVTAVQNPLTPFADDVAATNRALALQTGQSFSSAILGAASSSPRQGWIQK